ncbi:unnamed protein product [Spirodela intermedia]|uniref:Uncharacterized protein n=1 Tax=Spirodela intermedia TaxID=51605 RepID=A0A7I8INW7_SPIIN|nr:unnamed protein product [Spirodela intermedia]CAA6659637.1 unnamed protein product [Spirodela intermedia]
MARSSVESSSSSEGEEDDENVVLRDTDRISMSKSFGRPAKASPSSKTSPSAAGAGEDDPESPGGSSSSGDGRNTGQSVSEVSVSEGEGSSSEGVLVEHPLNPDQDSRSMHGDPDSGILVNIDGSMHEGDRESDDGGREDTFVDAPDELSFSEGRSSKACGREIVTLYETLRAMTNSQSGLVSGDNTKAGDSDDDSNTFSLSPMDAIIKGCSEIASHLKSDWDERQQLENHARGLSVIVFAKNQEIEELKMEVAENSMSRDIVFSYLNSLQEAQTEYLRQSTDAFVWRLLSSLATVVTLDEEDLEKDVLDGFSLVEKRTTKLIEKHSQFLSEISQLGRCLSTVQSDFMIPQHNELKLVFDAARQELLEGKSKEKEKDEILERLYRMTHDLEEAKVEASKAKAGLEQAESKFMTVKEKLSMAVTKGKSLVQHRDALKKLLSDKTAELERCLLELQQKSEALDSTQARVEELSKSEDIILSLQDSLSQQSKVLCEIEEVVSQIDYPMNVPSVELVDKVRCLVDQKHTAEGVLQGYSKLQGALSSVDLPQDVSSSDSESQLNWLLRSFTESKENAAKLRDELSSMQAAVISCESQLLEANKEIDGLTASISERREEVSSLQDVNEDLKSKYEGIVEKLSHVSSEKNQLMKVLIDLSESTEDQSSQVIDTLIENCLGKAEEWRRTAHESSVFSELFQRMQSLVFMKEQELALSTMICEEERLDRAVVMNMSNQLKQAYEEIKSLRNEKDGLQKDFERVEESQKGKGLVQDREGLKLSLDEKNSEIQKLQHDLQLQDSATAELKGQIEILSADVGHIKQLEIDIASLKQERDQMKQLLRESGDSFQKMVGAINHISLPYSINSEDPAEKLKRISEYIHEVTVVKASKDQELEQAKDEALTLIALSEMEKKVSAILEEKEDAKLGKVSAEQELEKVKEDVDSLTDKLTQSYVTIRNLENALSQAENSISILTNEKNGIEGESKLEIISLNAKLAACVEELVEARDKVENRSAELISHLRNLETLTKDEGLFVMMVEGFREKIEGLKSFGLLIENLRDRFAASGLEGNPDSELLLICKPCFLVYYVNCEGEFSVDNIGRAHLKDPHLEKLFSFPPFEDYCHAKLATIDSRRADEVGDTPSLAKVVEASSIQMNNLMERFRDFSGYVDEHITLLLQALQTIVNDADGMMEYREKLSVNLKNLEAHNQAQETKVLALQKNLTTVLSACRQASHHLRIEFDGIPDADSSVEHERHLSAKLHESREAGGGEIEEYNENSITVECDIVAVELLGAVERVKAKAQKSLKGISEDCMKLFMGNQVETLFDRLNMIEVPFKESAVNIEGQSFSSPVDKIFYILDNVARLQVLVSSMIQEKDEMQSTLGNYLHEIEQFREASENYAVISQDLEDNKSNLVDLSQGLEKVILKLGGYEFLESKRPVDTKGLLQLLEWRVMASLQDSESLKSRVQELGAKLQESQALNEDLSSSIKLLEDSIHARSSLTDVSKERTVSEGSSLVSGSEILEIEDGHAQLFIFQGHVGKKSVSPVPAAAHARTTRKPSSDHLALNVDTESERLISSRGIDDKGHVFKSLNTSGLIPKQGKHVADRIDGLWVSAGRLLMGRPEARMGLVAYWLLLHVWLIGTIL